MYKHILPGANLDYHCSSPSLAVMKYFFALLQSCDFDYMRQIFFMTDNDHLAVKMFSTGLEVHTWPVTPEPIFVLVDMAI